MVNANQDIPDITAQTPVDDDATRSILESTFSGFIAQRDDVPGDYKPTLISNRLGGLTMHDQISEALTNSDAFDISVAFVSTGAVLSLFEDFRSHHAKAGSSAGTTGTSRLITSTKGHFNDPKAFWELLHLKNATDVDVRVWEGAGNGDTATAQGQPFHPKGYVFARRMRNDTPYYDLFIGSSNLTGAALNTQREWNLKVSSLANGELVEQVREEIDSQVAESVPLTKEWIKQYEEDFKKYAPPRRDILESLKGRDIQPNAMQREALANLKKLREQGEHRAIIVSATGTGKTYLSAFDVRAYKPKRMLYIAQQQMILTKAMESYQKVLGCDESELGLYSGTSKQQDRKYVFATIQTLAKAESLAQFASDEFDYILVDEAHHAGADTYQRVIDHFKDADFMLGMTATPERLDGFNVFETFGHNIAYEIRLQRALDEGMLCPFHYYGVAEYLGTQDVEYSDNQGRTHAVNHRIGVGTGDGLTTDESGQLQYEISQLATEERVRYIIDKLQEYGQFHLPVTGLVFCSRQDEAQELSRLFNQQWNQQAERLYRTAAVTSKGADGKAVSQEQRDEYVRRLEAGELDYLFTVDMFNEGVDIPSLNQIVMLRNTESSIIFTQQLGRGLRKFLHKDNVVVIDFIGNYANNYLIPVALYGNTGDRDRARKNLQRKSIGLSSISFDPIAKERVLKSLDTADWSEMKKLTTEYRRVRFELGRIPMLTDIYDYDPSLPYTLASKSGNYLDFVRSREKSLSRRNTDGDFLDQLEPISDTENGILKMATSTLLPGLRPHELVILDELCRFHEERLGRGTGEDSNPAIWQPTPGILDVDLAAAIRRRFPESYVTEEQLDSAIHVLDYSYFDASRTRFGGAPLLERTSDGMCRLTREFVDMLRRNRTFRVFFADTLQVGLRNCRDLYETATRTHQPSDRGFLYGQKYALADVMRLCGWHKELNGQNVGGYFRHKETDTMPIFVKYAASQYEDQFLNPQEMEWFSKNNRTPHSPEFQWMQAGIGKEAHEHFVPLFVMRKAEEADKKYYYVGYVAALDHPTLTTKPTADGEDTVNVTLSTLRLARPLDPELYRHLVG